MIYFKYLKSNRNCITRDANVLQINVSYILLRFCNINATYMRHHSWRGITRGVKKLGKHLQAIFLHLSIEGTPINIKKSCSLGFITTSGTQCFSYVIFLTDKRLIGAGLNG
jgi:hypothetical protein